MVVCVATDRVWVVLVIAQRILCPFYRKRFFGEKLVCATKSGARFDELGKVVIDGNQLGMQAVVGVGY